MQGYYRDEAATREAFDGDWLRTGDMGHFDEQGRLILTGRRKEILVLSTGKNVSCALLEQALQRSPYIQQAFVIGEGRKFVTALIIPNRQKLTHDTRAMRFGGFAFDARGSSALSGADRDLPGGIRALRTGEAVFVSR